MEEPRAAEQGREDPRVADPGLSRVGGVDGALALAPDDWLGDGQEVRGPQERSSSAEERGEEGRHLAVHLLEAAPAVDSASLLEGAGCQVAEDKGSGLQERPVDVEEERTGDVPVAQKESAESEYLQTCHEANGGLSNKGLRDPCGEAICSKDVGCIYNSHDKVTEESQRQQDASVANGGDWSSVADVSTSVEDLLTPFEEGHHNNHGLSDLKNHGSEQLPCSVDGVGLSLDSNDDQQQNSSMPNIEAQASSPVHEDSVPSVTGRIGVSLDGKTVWSGQISVDSVTSHVTDGDLWNNKSLCAPIVEASQSTDFGYTNDTVNMVTEGSSCQHGSLAGNGCVSSCSSPKTRLEDLKMCRNGDDKGLPNLVKLDIEQVPHGMAVTCLKEAANHDLENNDLRQKTAAEDSWALHEHSVSGSDIPISFDGKAVQIGELSEHRASMENVVSGSCEEGRVSCGSCAVKEMQHISENYGASELAPNRDTFSFSYNQSCGEEPCCSSGKSSAQFLGHQSSGIGRTSPMEHLEPGLNACNFADEKDGSGDFASNANDGESQSQKQATLVVFRRRNPKRLASSRNLNSEKPDQIKKKNSAAGRSKKIDMATSLSTMSMFPQKITKGRSGIIRSPKPSVWGSVQKLLDDFSQSCGPLTSHSHPCFEKGRLNEISDETIRPSFRKSRSSRSSKGKCSTLSDMGHLTDESNGQPVFSAIPKQPLLNNGTPMLPVGFSPDSVLEIASVTCESNASASHDITLHENSSDAGALNESGQNPSFLSSSDSGNDQAPSSMCLEQGAKTAGGSEDSRKGRSGLSHTITENVVGEEKGENIQKSNTARKNRKQGCKKKDLTKGKALRSRSSTQISSSEASKLRAFSKDSVSSDLSESMLHTGHSELASCFEVQTSATQNLGTHVHGNVQSHSVTDSGRAHKKKNGNAGKKGKVRDPHAKGKSKKKNIADDTSLDRGLFSLPSAELAASHLNEKSNQSPATELALKNSTTISTDLPGNVACNMEASVPALPPPPRAAWVCCDDCQKWRCIPAELADEIGETNCRWTCKDNNDKAFADCSIPQEKTNAEINAELELSDASADEADNDGSISKACRAPSWNHIRSNLFLHRNRRTQSIDESMVCNCKPPQDGRMGCRDGCLNRMLNIECVKRTCPCGEQCSNQKFQHRSYAKLRWFHSGKKGYGLQLKEDVSEGRFLIEYVGEVLDISSYESRQKYYASKGQKHFYFMALNGGEVIDACTKGNLGRFINHSCSPNCRTEKWMVNGEVCIGIFALRNIKKGEELTFDYNYVRVSGAAPQKCFCGTAKCRGYIGGEISVETTTQDDAEVGNFGQTVVDKDSEGSIGADVSGSQSSHPDIAEPESFSQGDDVHDFLAADPQSQPQQTGETLFDTSEIENSLDAWSRQEEEDVVRTPVHVSRTIESSIQHFPVQGIQLSDCSQKTPHMTEALKVPINGLTPNCDLGNNQASGLNPYKRNNQKHHKNLKQSYPSDNEHILGVEGRLNNLLDGDGGISKRKDATNGYLKLLFMTAAEGDNTAGTSKSVRDLSLILDALLKTKSRTVLLDIIKKNGLQMLHNILKQNRSNFHRIPIIRKLLKVLEFLALKGILTPEHINGGPRFAGDESFRDSMLSLTRHNDMQVHQIARSFRDRWIPRSIARSEPTEYPRASTSGQDNWDSWETNTLQNCSTRKRKSRWDYQPAEHYNLIGLKIQKAYSGHGEFNCPIDMTRDQLPGNHQTDSYQNVVPSLSNSRESADEEAPPGFEPQQGRPVQASVDFCVAPSLCMERYQPSLNISYGIPVALVQHFGTPEAEGQCHQKWKVAPGVPFIPFPPLPPYPRGSPCPSTSSSQMSQHDATSTVKYNNSGNCGRTLDRGGRVHRAWRNGPRTRWPYNNQGRRFPSNHQRHERFNPSRHQ